MSHPIPTLTYYDHTLGDCICNECKQGRSGMNYFMIQSENGYWRTYCEKCEVFHKGESHKIQTEEERKNKCFDCGENTPIRKSEVK